MTNSNPQTFSDEDLRFRFIFKQKEMGTFGKVFLRAGTPGWPGSRAGSGRGRTLTAGTVGKLLLNIVGGQFVAVPQLVRAPGFQIKAVVVVVGGG